MDPLVQLARGRIGVSRYHVDATLDSAPHLFRCSSFVCWLFFVTYELSLPLGAPNLYAYAQRIPYEDIRPTDLVFIKPTDPTNRNLVGHVGILGSTTTFIHATRHVMGVEEIPLSRISPSRLVGFGRITI